MPTLHLQGNLLDQGVDVIFNAWNLILWWLLLPQGISGAIKRRVGIAPFQELCKFRVPTLDGAMVTGNLWCESLAGCSARMGDRLGCRPSSASCSTASPASGSSASA
jgi:hypothetical protein